MIDLNGIDDESVLISTLFSMARARADKASGAFPQPNYVMLKLAEEAGEVVRAGVHLSENRDCSRHDMLDEIVDLFAMCIRLAVEGDEVNGVPGMSK